MPTVDCILIALVTALEDSFATADLNNISILIYNASSLITSLDNLVIISIKL